VDFTIVTPSFRQLEKLAGCIASIADQQGVQVEHLVQDGGTEGFRDFAETMARRWPDRPGYRRIMVSQPDKGMYDAINQGLKRAAGNLCAYLNCDEQYEAGILHKVRAVAETHPQDDVWVGDVVVVGEGGEALCHRKILPPTLRHTWTCHLAAFTAATFFRKSLVDRGFLFSSVYRAAADAEWFVRILESGRQPRRLGFVCASFMEGKENLGLSPVAREERNRLNQTAPRWMRSLSWAWVLEHRIRRWLGECHQRTDVTYSLFLLDANRRTQKMARHLRTSWPGRLWQK